MTDAHATAIIEDGARIGEGTLVWHFSHVRSGAQIGKNCVIGKSVYVDAGVRVGDAVKIQNAVSIYNGVTLEDGVFVGPHVTFTNDKTPRAVDPDMNPLGDDDWQVSATRVERGASIGAHATILCGLTLSEWCMVAAGAVVTRDIPPFALAVGNPAKLAGIVDKRGNVIHRPYEPGTYADIVIL